MKTLKTTLALCIVHCTSCIVLCTSSFSQCIPDIKIDGNSVIADENHPYGIKLPSWLTAGQTLERGNNVFSISVIEFTVNGTSLDYSQNLSITTPVQTVPANKVWKIESVHKNAQFTPSVVATYSVAGSYTFTPTCSGYYKIQVWGSGGGGGGGDACTWCYCNGVGGAGGGGGYTEATFFLSSGTPYTATVATGGAGRAMNSQLTGGTGGTSIFNGPSSISATGGGGGVAHTSAGCVSSPTGGSGGNGSGGQANVTGQSGANGNTSSINVKGGDGANGGGTGGTGTANGGFPGGGGGGANGTSGSGAVGRIIVSLGGGTISSSRVPCVTLYLYNTTNCTTVATCPTGWNDGGCGPFMLSTGNTYCRTCYRCD